MAREFAYAVVLAPEPSGGFVVSCPDFPELLTQGEDRTDAIEQAADALEEVLAARIRRAEDIPDPSTPAEDQDVVVVRVPPIIAAKAALALALRETATNQTALARTLGVDEKEVRRLLDPRHPSKLTRLQAALQTLDREVEIRVVGVATPEISQTEARSYNVIADAAEALAGKFFPRNVAGGRAIPIHELLSAPRLRELSGAAVTIEADENLREEAISEYSHRAVAVRLRPDVWEGAKSGNARFRFTVAHEIAHVVLHRSDLIEHRGRAFRDVVTPADKLPPDVPIYCSPEWQANAWAGAFLMPAGAARAYLRRLAKGRREFSQAAFAANFQVSLQAAGIRLEKLLPELVGKS